MFDELCGVFINFLIQVPVATIGHRPIDDGNGRIARAISDMLLARSEESSQRFYSLSNQILTEKKKYYEILQKIQHSSGDITDGLAWFLNCLYRALENTEETLKRVLIKADFWDKNKETILNSRQRLMLNNRANSYFQGKHIVIFIDCVKY